MSKSILQKYDGSCYLCSLLHGDDSYYSWLEEHHVFGASNRKLSEHFGLKVKLCNWHHNQTGSESVHNNEEVNEMLKRVAQRAYEEKYGHASFMATFMKNHLDEAEWVEVSCVG